MVVEPIDQHLAEQAARRHGLDWHYTQQTESTNADALLHYDRHRRELVAFSESQSAGRGRRGRQWHSPPARNIYCTVGLFKALPADRQGLLSIVTGLALCRVLRRSAAAVELKWPNDLLFDGRKLGGILIESRPHDAARFFFAIGFGLNVFMTDEELAAIGQPAASLERVSTLALDRTRILIAAIDEVVESIRGFDHEASQGLVAEFESVDAYHGQQVEVITGSDAVRGLNRGITASGQLRLETEQGLQLHSAAEISLRPARR
ncbi:MAG: biotin--[acetyl-CoA-carboxylase] ligase [Gammaproteobacteria bacterium]|nr:biotin--[acetyl-CoA-carboxylase] ligase [Gammaproteobacteria bacterium]MDH3537073.1 biotin--[acetyl-CoA-carboxylase] ligase [Gammaproteobacteria bacterium]